MDQHPSQRDEPRSTAIGDGVSAEGSEIESKPTSAGAPAELSPDLAGEPLETTEDAGGSGAASVNADAGSAPGTIVGRRYEILEFLGSGRRGTVLLARDRLTDAKVAVKRLRTDGELRDASEMAMRAAEVQAVMRHPQIVRVFDVGEDSSGPYIVSEFIDGPDLARHVATQGAMDVSRAIQTVSEIGEAIIAAHDRGLFHGSIRGSNVLLGPDGALKVSDFAIEGISQADEPRARRQDVRGLARTLCQLLTGVSRGTINVHELPKPVRPVIRHAMGRSVAARQSTMEHFLRELRATELEIDSGVLSEADAIRRGRDAELSGSFAAMREAGQEAQAANAESAEAMVLLRRADTLEAEKNELIRLVSEREGAFDYAGALEALGKLIRKFPADHHAIRLAGQKRQTLAELTRLRGLGEQMVAAGRIAESVGTWQRVIDLRPDDPAAQEHVRLGKRARTKRRLVAASAAAAAIVIVGGAAWTVWSFTSVREVPGLFGNPPAGATQADAGTSGGSPTGTSAPVTTNPLVRSPASAAGADAGGAASRETAVADAETSAADEGLDGIGAADAESTVADSEAARAARELAEAELAASQAARDAASARSHAIAAGAAGLAADTFEVASRRHEDGQRLLESGRFAEATDAMAAARGIYVNAAGAARAEIAAIETLIGSKRLRAAQRSLDEIHGLAPATLIGELTASMDEARSRTVEIAPAALIELRYVEPGAFEMGSEADEPGRRATEDRRLVRIEQPFWIMRTELTRGMYAAIGGESVELDAADLPLTGLTLDDAKAIAALLSERAPGTFSVPTEAQWEYAARADQDGAPDAESLRDQAWWLGTAEAQLRPVGRLSANPWGLVDTLGNAAELVVAPGLGHGEQVAMTRGGSYLSPQAAVRPAARHELVPRDRGDSRTGVRFIWRPDELAGSGRAAEGDRSGRS